MISRLVGQPVTVEQVTLPTTAPKVSWGTLFTPRLRRLVVFTSVPWFLLDIVVYGIGVFTPTVFAGAAVIAGDSLIDTVVTSLRQTALTEIFLALGFVGALLLINRVAPVRLQGLGFVLMAFGLGLLALSAAVPMGGQAAYLLALLGFALSNFFQNMGPNSTTFLMPAVVFPTAVRATGAGFGAAAGKAGAVLITLVFPAMEANWGLPATVGLMAIGSVGAAVVTIIARPRNHAEASPVQ